MMYLVLRNNNVKMSLTDPTIKADGTIWVHGTPLLGITDDAIKAKAADACNRQAWSEIPADAYTRVGDNPNGLTVIKQSDYLAAKRAALTPAQRERREINDLFTKANRLENSDRDDNVCGPMILRSRAHRMLLAWQTKYPAEAAEEKRQAMLCKAAHLRDMASGALTYDMDGSIGPEEQRKRHDDFIAQARAIRAEAAK